LGLGFSYAGKKKTTSRERESRQAYRQGNTAMLNEREDTASERNTGKNIDMEYSKDTGDVIGDVKT